MKTSTKTQTPNSKEAPMRNRQTPTDDARRTLSGFHHRVVCEVWSLEFLWCLVFGVWCFSAWEFSVS
jgi:hypothetical protein